MVFANPLPAKKSLIPLIRTTYLSSAIATVMRMLAVMAMVWSGYRKYGKRMMWVLVVNPKSFLSDSKIPPNRQTLSKQASAIRSRLKEFRMSGNEEKERKVGGTYIFLSNKSVRYRRVLALQNCEMFGQCLQYVGTSIQLQNTWRQSVFLAFAWEPELSGARRRKVEIA